MMPSQDFLQLAASLVEGLWKKTRKGEKGTEGKKRKEKPWDKDHVGQFWFLPKQKCCTMWG